MWLMIDKTCLVSTMALPGFPYAWKAAEKSDSREKNKQPDKCCSLQTKHKLHSNYQIPFIFGLIITLALLLQLWKHIELLFLLSNCFVFKKTFISCESFAIKQKFHASMVLVAI